MNHNLLPSDLSLLMVTAELTKPDGSVLVLSKPEISGTSFTYTARMNSFGDSDVGNYTCNATIRPRQPSSTFLTGMGHLVSDPINVEIGMRIKYHQLT
jgi:hypothetical protein